MKQNNESEVIKSCNFLQDKYQWINDIQIQQQKQGQVINSAPLYQQSDIYDIVFEDSDEFKPQIKEQNKKIENYEKIEKKEAKEIKNNIDDRRIVTEDGLVLIRCQYCNRRFGEAAIQRHEKACIKNPNHKRNQNQEK